MQKSSTGTDFSLLYIRDFLRGFSVSAILALDGKISRNFVYRSTPGKLVRKNKEKTSVETLYGFLSVAIAEKAATVKSTLLCGVRTYNHTPLQHYKVFVRKLVWVARRHVKRAIDHNAACLLQLFPYDGRQ